MSAGALRRYPRYAISSPNAANVQTNNKANNAIFALPAISFANSGAFGAGQKKSSYRFDDELPKDDGARQPRPVRSVRSGAMTKAA